VPEQPASLLRDPALRSSTSIPVLTPRRRPWMTPAAPWKPLRLRCLPSAASRDHRGAPGRHADRQRQVALLPDTIRV